MIGRSKMNKMLRDMITEGMLLDDTLSTKEINDTPNILCWLDCTAQTP